MIGGWNECDEHNQYGHNFPEQKWNTNEQASQQTQAKAQKTIETNGLTFHFQVSVDSD